MDTEFAIAATEPISLLSFMELCNHSFYVLIPTKTVSWRVILQDLWFGCCECLSLFLMH